MGMLLPPLTMATTLVILMGPSICALLRNVFPGHPFTQFPQEHPQAGEDRAATQGSDMGTSSHTDVTSLSITVPLHTGQGQSQVVAWNLLSVFSGCRHWDKR